MANVNITPKEALLTSGQAETFEATNASGQPIPVTWSLSPEAEGSLLGAGNKGGASAGVSSQSASATYVAPPSVVSAKTVTVVASTENGSAGAIVRLTPVSIIPAKVDLKTNQSQRFVVSVERGQSDAASATNPDKDKIDWILSPQIGTLTRPAGGGDDSKDQGSGRPSESAGGFSMVYTPSKDLVDSTTVSIIATTTRPGEKAIATINLTSPPWQGFGVNLLGFYLLCVFALVILMVFLWPPALPTPDGARADRIDAERTLEGARERCASAKTPTARPAVEPTETPSTPSGAQSKANKPGTPADASSTRAKEKAGNATKEVASSATSDCALDEQVQVDSKDLERKRHIEEAVNSTSVRTALAGDINRELDLIWLILLAGSLGSFLHMAQSYSEFIGNRTLKSSWAWWYSLGPFIGAGLALVFYAAVRGGFMAMATGSSAKASELNPFGVVSVAAMVGMFSKAATIKLGEVFDTLFKSDKAKESKDPVTGTPQNSAQTGAKPATSESTSKGTK